MLEPAFFTPYAADLQTGPHHGGKMFLKSVKRMSLAVLLLSGCLSSIGCTPAEESEMITQLQSALTDLSANRALTEQFVRDVKSNADPDDPAYLQAMESYQDAREAYNRYLDAVESGMRPDDSRALHRVTARDVQNATADFLADATRALKPSVNTRRVAFQRAVMVPENLQTTLARLPKKARRSITDQFDDEVRWRSWSQL